MQVLIGTNKAIEGYRDPNSDNPELVQYRDLPGERITEVRIPDGVSLREAFLTVCGAMECHLAEGETPVWIESDSEGAVALLVEHYGIANNIRPESWGRETDAHLVMPGVITTTLMVLWSLLLLKLLGLELRTNAGRDFQARVMGDNASTGTGNYHSACYIGLTADTGVPNAADTVLAGEITAGTLARAQASWAHTNGASTYTLTKTFTSDQSVVAVKLGIFNGPGPGGAAGPSNTLAFETMLDNTASMVSGDQIQITDTVTI